MKKMLLAGVVSLIVANGQSFGMQAIMEGAARIGHKDPYEKGVTSLSVSLGIHDVMKNYSCVTRSCVTYGVLGALSVFDVAALAKDRNWSCDAESRTVYCETCCLPYTTCLYLGETVCASCCACLGLDWISARCFILRDVLHERGHKALEASCRKLDGRCAALQVMVQGAQAQPVVPPQPAAAMHAN